MSEQGKTGQPALEHWLIEEICRAGRGSGLKYLILFGSRATGQNAPRSDIDLAGTFSGGSQYMDFLDRLEEIRTLLIFDVTNQNGITYSRALDDEIRRDGIYLYDDRS